MGEAARLHGTEPVTLRKSESTGELLPARKTKGGARYYDVSELMGYSNEAAPTLCYCRVSGHDQKPDLDRQQELLEACCSEKGWRTQVIRKNA
ncbi:IS607 family transposase [Endozoicomonas sp. 8E]|uniref:IS607 family transposase n=1 Tax=Endozoicomonas sp. 8E TaxID=3035692 RepID=UPI00397727F2